MRLETLRTALKRTKKDPGPKFHGHCKVPFAVEHTLASFCTSLADRGTPATDEFLLKLASAAVEGPLTKNWLIGFKDRWQTLLRRSKSTSMEAARITSLSASTLESWIEAYQAEQRYILEDGSNLFNADEVPAKYSANSPVLVWASKWTAKVGCMDSREQAVKTFVPFISASGRLWMLLLIYESTKDQKETDVFLPAVFSDSEDPPFTTLLASTTKGYMTTDLWRSACGAFSKLLYAEFAQKECVLVLDNLSAHANVDTVSKLARGSLRSFFIPPHTSHFLQPLDNGGNAAIATEVRKARATLFRDSTITGGSVTGATPSLIVAAALKRLTPAVISGCWERTGLFPFNPDLVRSLSKPYVNAINKNAPTPASVLVEDIARRFFDTAIDLASTPKKSRGTITSKSPKVLSVEQVRRRHGAAIIEREQLKVAEKEAKKAAAAQKKLENRQRKAELKAAMAKKPKQNELSFCVHCADDCRPEDLILACSEVDHGGACPNCWSMLNENEKKANKCLQC